MTYPGGETLYLVSDAVTRDGNGDPVLDAMGATQKTEVLVRVDGCVFEPQVAHLALVEKVDVATTTTNDIRWAFLPVVGGQVPGFDNNNTAVLVDPPTSDMRIKFRGRTWQLRGDAAVEVDLDGVENHVFALCERPGG